MQLPFFFEENIPLTKNFCLSEESSTPYRAGITDE